MCLSLVLVLCIMCKVIVLYLRQTRRQYAQKQTQATTTCINVNTQTYSKTVSVQAQTSTIKWSVPVQTDFQKLRAETQTDPVTLSGSFRNNPVNQVKGTPRPRRLSQFVSQINANRRIPSPMGRGHILNSLPVQGVGRGIDIGNHHGHSNASGRGHMLNSSSIRGVERGTTLRHHNCNAIRRRPMWPLPSCTRR